MARKHSASGGEIGSRKGAARTAAGPQPAPAAAAAAHPPVSVPTSSCTWTPDAGFVSRTKRGGEVKMFGDGGHRAADIMLLSVGACLNYFLVEHVKSRNLPVTAIRVTCGGEWTTGPERLSKIITRVVIEGGIDDEERRRMLHDCQQIWKVMNSIRNQPECATILVSPNGKEIA